jgi:hypothetical protein
VQRKRNSLAAAGEKSRRQGAIAAKRLTPAAAIKNMSGLSGLAAGPGEGIRTGPPALRKNQNERENDGRRV